MIIKNYQQVNEEKVEMKGGSGATVRWLIDDKIGLSFAMRRYELKGSIPLHRHAYEHEVYFLEGQGEIIDADGNIRSISKGDFAYIPPNEAHGFKNNGKGENLVFLCLVPKQRGAIEFLE